MRRLPSSLLLLIGLYYLCIDFLTGRSSLNNYYCDAKQYRNQGKANGADGGETITNPRNMLQKLGESSSSLESQKSILKVTGVGTRMTGVGSRSKRNRSIFLSKSLSKSLSSSSSSGDLKKGEQLHEHNQHLKDKDIDYQSLIKSRMFVKVTKHQELLLFFPSDKYYTELNDKCFSGNHHDLDSDSEITTDNIGNNINKWSDEYLHQMGTVISLSTKNSHEPLNSYNDLLNKERKSFMIHAELWNNSHNIIEQKRQIDRITKEKQKKRGTRKKRYTSNKNDHHHHHHQYHDNIYTSSQLSHHWIPVEGLYGIWNFPSGPHLILITEGEDMYQSNDYHFENYNTTKDRYHQSNPLMHLRKIKSMEIVPLPLKQDQQKQLDKKLEKIRIAQQSQLNLLRQSFKEHNFYFVPTMPTPFLQAKLHGDENHSSFHDNDDDRFILRDITHTIQRSFMFWNERKKAEEKEVQEKKLEEHQLQQLGTNFENQCNNTKVSFDQGHDETVPSNNSLIDDGNDTVNSSISESMSIVQNNLDTSQLNSTKNMSIPSSNEDSYNKESLGLWLTLKSSFSATSLKNQNDVNTGIKKEVLDIVKEELVSNEVHSSDDKMNNVSQATQIEKETGFENDIRTIDDRTIDDIYQNKENVNRFHCWWIPLLESLLKTKFDGYKTMQRPDNRFFWNEECILPLLHSLSKSIQNYSNDLNTPCAKPYMLLLENTFPITSAFIGVQKDILLALKTKPQQLYPMRYDQLLISRRSKYRAGTRFTKRGADGTGDVANFAETEQVCIVWNIDKDPSQMNNDKERKFSNRNHEGSSSQEIYSHVQTRGSIPLRWSSPTDIKTYRPKVLIGTDPLAQARALRSHLIEQLSLYSCSSSESNHHGIKLVFVNLIDKHSDQGRLGKAFDAVLGAILKIYGNESVNSDEDSSLRELSSDTVSHIWFDFHAECKKGRWYRLRNLLDEVIPTLDKQGFFCASSQNIGKHLDWTVQHVQNGAIRTNCMDCLDRTNVVQSMFGRYILFKQLNERHTQHNARKRKLPLEYSVAFRRDMLKLPWIVGESSHRLLWADNADEMSRLYAGTPALKGDFTRTGKRTKRGALDDGVNSVTRFYLNNFIDADRQKGMDLLTGFTDFELNLEEETAKSFANNKVSYKRKPNNRQWTNSIFDSKKIETEILYEKRLNLGWLPGDLEGHLRSAALSAQNSRLSSVKVPSSSFFPIADALKDIGRRASIENPWWVDDSDESFTAPKSTTFPISTSGHVMGALIALGKVPLTTAVMIVCLVVPGIANINN